MNIGIIVHSQTGNTYAVAQKLEEKLKQAGHTVGVERITTIGNEKAGVDSIQLDKMPGIDEYDALIFGGWVQAFGLCPGMTAYLKQLTSMENKKVACFVTMYFPFTWLGGKSATVKMAELCRVKGGTVCQTGVVKWSKKDREEKIKDLINEFSQLF